MPFAQIALHKSEIKISSKVPGNDAKLYRRPDKRDINTYGEMDRQLPRILQLVINYTSVVSFTLQKEPPVSIAQGLISPGRGVDALSPMMFIIQSDKFITN
jgi:hypothetical protein